MAMSKVLYIGNVETGRWIEKVLSSTKLAVEQVPDYVAARAKLSNNGQDTRMPILVGMPIDTALFDFIGNIARPCIVVVKIMDYELLTKLRENKAAGYIVEGSSSQEVFFRIQNVIHTTEGVRKNQRVIATVPIEYRSKGQNYEAMSYSFSRQGVFIVTEEILPINTELYVRFRLSESEPFIACAGKVSYAVKKEEGKTAAYPNGMAVVFVGIKGSDQSRIDAYIKQLEQE